MSEDARARDLRQNSPFAGSTPDAPEALLRSMEVDLFPRKRPERAIEIEGEVFAEVA